MHAKNNTHSGITVQHASSVIAVGTDIQSTNNQGSGIEVGGSSSVQLWGAAATRKTASALFDSNGGAGISVWGSSSFNVWDDGVAVNVISTNNAWRGLDVWGSSAVGFTSPASEPTSRLVFNGNGAEGVEVAGNATLHAGLPSEIRGNALEGVGLWSGGHVGLQNATISGNSGLGIVVLKDSSLWLSGSRVNNNGLDGIEVSNSSNADFHDIEVTGNGGNGISVYNHGFAQAYQDVGSDISRNGGNGISMWNGASIQLFNATVTGNSSGAISASFGSRFYFSGGAVTGNIYCDDSVLSQGDVSCPE